MRGKGTELGEGERKVRLSQDRMPIPGEGERDFAQMPFAQMSLRANVTQPHIFLICLRQKSFMQLDFSVSN